MTRNTEWSLLVAVCGLLVALLVCICLLALPVYDNKMSQVEIEVVKQEFTSQLHATDRKYEQKVNNLQEQISSLQFIANKRYELREEDIRSLKRDNADLKERLKARTEIR